MLGTKCRPADLPKGRLSISQIALETGFAHPSHLAHHMRGVQGVSPKTLREMLRWFQSRAGEMSDEYITAPTHSAKPALLSQNRRDHFRFGPYNDRSTTQMPERDRSRERAHRQLVQAWVENRSNPSNSVSGRLSTRASKPPLYSADGTE
jgi:hypothetical protein